MDKDSSKEVRCSFIGHRTVENSELISSLLKDKIIALIEQEGVNTFLFGSRSAFDDLCHSVVTELREVYPFINRVAYTCRSEAATMEYEREDDERAFSKLMGKEIHLKGFESEVEFAKKYEAGRASYIERNQAMIDDSNYCIFYYNDSYSPRGAGRSGTRIAYDYAKRVEKRKQSQLVVINIFPQ